MSTSMGAEHSFSGLRNSRAPPARRRLAPSRPRPCMDIGPVMDANLMNAETFARLWPTLFGTDAGRHILHVERLVGRSTA